jgi:hypothetical protein
MEGKRRQSEETGRILRFERPGAPSVRGYRHPVGIPSYRPQKPAIEDIGSYEGPREEPGEFRHRQVMNVVTLLICAVLIVTGIWIANKMAELRRDQDCVLAGRRNCAEITIMGNTAR